MKLSNIFIGFDTLFNGIAWQCHNMYEMSIVKLILLR